ncbi:hypothetical protein HYX15_03830 [Candidatus Woesearchaeota archaeon]|nr:hypothetical protein [Candidatus Woesearchaeota archaeon]
MKYKARSIVVGRMKRDEKDKEKDDMFRPCFIALYDFNDPHLKAEPPKQILEFKKIDKVNIDRCAINYLLAGNDLVVNDLQYVEVTKRRNQLFLNGKQMSRF